LNLDKRKENLSNWSKEPRQAAAYLDSKMDELGVDRYTFIGSNGHEIYGWTKHSPDGPYFVQYNWWFNDISGFGDSIVSNVERADIVVVSHMWKEIAPQVNQILDEQFTKQQVKRYQMYFRKK
jgi:hypothetical protein